MKTVVLDTNLYVDWLARGDHEAWVVGPGLRRHMSAVVAMELRVGARTLPGRRAVQRLTETFHRTGRTVTPTAAVFEAAGEVLQRLADTGREIRRASLTHDVLIALSARAIGATVVTRDTDFEAIAAVSPFALHVLR
ncbi:MAG: type II toxin-antitoxin system VapC family toxin [Sandaracinus sp.]